MAVFDSKRAYSDDIETFASLPMSVVVISSNRRSSSIRSHASRMRSNV